MGEKEMLNEKEQELRNQINESKFGDAAAWLARHDGQKLEAIIRDALAPESALYYQLMSGAPLFWTLVEAIGLDIERAVEITFIRQLSAEKVSSLATIMEENDMSIRIVGDVEITSNSDLLRIWNDLHPDEKPMYKYSYAEGPAGEETIRVKITRGVL